MNVGDLRRMLDGHADDTLVVLSKDAEGNSYSPLAAVDEPGTYVYRAVSTWSGEIEEATEDALGYPDNERAVVLWPTN